MDRKKEGKKETRLSRSSPSYGTLPNTIKRNKKKKKKKKKKKSFIPKSICVFRRCQKHLTLYRLYCIAI